MLKLCNCLVCLVMFCWNVSGKVFNEVLGIFSVFSLVWLMVMLVYVFRFLVYVLVEGMCWVRWLSRVCLFLVLLICSMVWMLI